MIEIFIIIQLCKSIGKKAREKGRSAGGYQAMLVGLWLAGEIVFGSMGILFSQSGPAAYFLALIGAVVGAISSFAIVKGLQPLNAEPRGHGFQGIQTTPPPREYR